LTVTIASEQPWPALEPSTGTRATQAGPDQPRGSRLGMLDDAALLLLIALLAPVVILVVGIPVALVIRLIMAIAQLF
jgi:hypothetical protein